MHWAGNFSITQLHWPNEFLRHDTSIMEVSLVLIKALTGAMYGTEGNGERINVCDEAWLAVDMSSFIPSPNLSMGFTLLKLGTGWGN
ncbi:putative cellulose synthase A catalytic subunit 1 [UDP-forming] [Bienertia sinuspersici]